MKVQANKNSHTANPISKFLAVIMLGLTVVNPIHPVYRWIIVLFISCLLYLSGEKKEAFKSVAIYLFLFRFMALSNLEKLHPLIKIPLSFLFIGQMFYLPFLAGKYFLRTSDVGSIISSMDILKIPSSFSIPIAVMFRFFPSYKEERANIKLAMKIRGISFKNPFKYMEYIMVPSLILSSNIIDDIAKAAETKCIAAPGRKTRYRDISFNCIDILYLSLILVLVGGSILW